MLAILQAIALAIETVTSKNASAWNPRFDQRHVVGMVPVQAILWPHQVDSAVWHLRPGCHLIHPVMHPRFAPVFLFPKGEEVSIIELKLHPQHVAVKLLIRGHSSLVDCRSVGAICIGVHGDELHLLV